MQFLDPARITTCDGVEPANHLPRSWCISFLSVRRCYFCVEQPLNSLFYHNPTVRVMLDWAPRVERCITWLGAFGHPSMKALELYHNVQELSMYIVRDKRTARSRMKESEDAPAPLTFQQTKSAAATSSSSATWRTGAWVTGNRQQMNESSAYPQEFADMMARCISGNYRNVQPRRTARHPELRGLDVD